MEYIRLTGYQTFVSFTKVLVDLNRWFTCVPPRHVRPLHPLRLLIQNECCNTLAHGGNLVYGPNTAEDSPEITKVAVWNPKLTRMHSSRMRTGRSLTVCCSLLPGGVCLVRGGVYLIRGGGGSPPGAVWSRGVWVCSRGGVSQHALRQTPPRRQNSWHTLVKILPWPNFVAAGKNVRLAGYRLCECIW